MQPNSGNPSHSKLGLVSFVISLLYVLFLLTLKIVNSYVLSPRQYTGLLLVALIAWGLGLTGIYQRNRNRLFPMLGLILSSACLVITITDFWMEWLNTRSL